MNLKHWLQAQTRSLASIAAWTGTLLLHLALFAWIWQQTQAVPLAHPRRALEVEWYLTEDTPPPPAPNVPPASVLRAVPRAAATPAFAPSPAPRLEPAMPAVPAAMPAATTLTQRIDHQRRAAAADIATEHAPPKRLFSGRSIDAMLPGADTGKLPGFRPQTSDDNRDALRRIGQMLSQALPSAAFNPDAPTDLLIEGWEAKHHGSDLAACELQYQDLDADLRRQMCGVVRPPP